MLFTSLEMYFHSPSAPFCCIESCEEKVKIYQVKSPYTKIKYVIQKDKHYNTSGVHLLSSLFCDLYYVHVILEAFLMHTLSMDTEANTK